MFLEKQGIPQVPVHLVQSRPLNINMALFACCGSAHATALLWRLTEEASSRQECRGVELQVGEALPLSARVSVCGVTPTTPSPGAQFSSL